MKENKKFKRLVIFTIVAFMWLSTVNMVNVTYGEPGAAHVVDGTISADEYEGGMSVELVGKTDPTWKVDAYIDWDTEYLYVAVNEPVPPSGLRQSWIEFAFDAGPTRPFLDGFTLFCSGTQRHGQCPKPPGTWSTVPWPHTWWAATGAATEFMFDYTDFGISLGDTIKMQIDRNDGSAVPPPPLYAYGFAAFWPQNAIAYPSAPDPTTWGDVTLSAAPPNVLPVADANGPYEDTDCDYDYTIIFDGSGSDDPDGTIVSYDWDFGDGTGWHNGLGATPSYTYSDFGDYTVTLRVTDSDGLTDTDTSTAEVYGVVANVNGPYEDTDCDDDYTIIFDGSGSTGYQMPLTYDWDFGDGTGWHNGLGATPSYTYSDFGDYTVTLRVTESGNGCSDTDTANVKIYGVIAESNGPYFTEDLNPIQFDSSGSHGYLEPLSYLWDFGDGETSTLENPTHIYTQVGDYTVTLTVTESSTNQCFDVDVAAVVIASTVTADAHGLYEGIVGIPVDFYGSAAGGVPAYSWYWSFGDHVYSPAQNPSHIYYEAGTYIVSLKVTDDINGYDRDAATVLIYPPEAVIADAGGLYTGGVDQVVVFTGNAVGGVSPYTFEWDLDNDGDYGDATGKSASKSWSTIGTYTIGIKVTDNIGTTDTDTAQVSITFRAPNKPSKPSGSTSGKANTDYTYTSSTTDPDGDDVFYLFDWDDGTDSGWLGPYDSGDTVTASHTWTEKGDYQIKVKAKDTYGVYSPWSDPLPITMPKNKAINPLLLFLERLMERFPILEQILQTIYDKLTGF